MIPQSTNDARPAPARADHRIGTGARGLPPRAGRLDVLIAPLLAALLLVALWTHGAWRMTEERTAAEEGGWRQAEVWTQRLAERTERLLRQVDLSTRLVAQMHVRFGSVELPAFLRRQMLPDEFGAHITLLDRHGQAIASTMPAMIGLSMDDLPALAAHRADQADRLLVDTPLRGRPGGNWVLPLSQRISGPDGEFLGLVLVTVDPALLTRDLIHDELGAGAMLLTMGDDGIVRAHDNGDRLSFGQRLSPQEWELRTARAHARGEAPADPFDGVTRFVATRPVPGYGLAVSVGLSRAEVLAPYFEWEHRFLFWMMLGSLTVAAGAAALTLQVVRLRRLQEQAERARTEFRAASDASLDAFHLLRAVRDGTGAVTDLLCVDTNERGARLFGLPREGVVGRRLTELLPEAQTLRFVRHCAAVMRNGRVREREFLAASMRLRADWIQQQVVPLADGVAITTRDVSARKRMEQEKERDRAFLRTMLEHLPVGVWAQRLNGDEPGRFLFLNRAARRLFALRADIECAGMTASQALGPALGRWLDDQGRRVAAGGRRLTQPEQPVDTAHGRRWLTVTTAPVGSGPADDWLLGLAVDTSEQRTSRDALQRMALYDALTGLPNRACFNARLQQAIDEAERGARDGFALLFIDVDHFKTVNDSIGHDAGDALLRGVAARLRGLVRDIDLVGRLGGDEFTVIAAEAGDREAAASLCGRVAEALAAPFDVGGQRLHVGASIGVCLYPDDGLTAELLLRRADLAMYRAKEGGRNGFRFFEPAMEAEAEAQLRVEQHLRGAIDAGELFLVYQPKFDLLADRICGWEALARWRHPEHGLVPPSVFIPIAERSDLIVRLGEWAIETACAQMRRWLDAGLAPGPVSVNVSARQFHRSDLTGVIRGALARHRLPASMLELELTESAMLADQDQAAVVLRELQALGVHVAIDDFGTGYSSLSTLSRLPVRTLKIDRSFLLSSARDATGVALLEGTVALVRSLGLRTVVEGVETEEQLALVRRCGCDEAQGWGLARPMEARDVEARLGVMEAA